MPDMTEEALLEALREAQSPDNPEDAMTREEIGNALGLKDPRTVRKRIRRLLDEGRIEHVPVRRQRMNKVVATTDGYRLTDRPEDES